MEMNSASLKILPNKVKSLKFLRNMKAEDFKCKMFAKGL